MSENKPSDEVSSPTSLVPVASADDSRRDFLKVAGIGGLGAALAAVAGVPAVAYIAYPLANETVSGGDDFLPAGNVDSFPEGKPVKVDLFADKRDAWNRVVQVKVGSAWVVNQGGKLNAYSTVCPHLGCAVDYDPDAGDFKCPCHRSAFKLDGRVEGGPAPRGLDSLEVKKDEGLVAIRFQRFKQGVSEKEIV